MNEVGPFSGAELSGNDFECDTPLVVPIGWVFS